MPDGKKVDPVVKATTKTAESLLPEIRKQFQFIRDYTASPKYQERLTKIINTEKVLSKSNNIKLSNELMSKFDASTPTSSIVADILNRKRKQGDILANDNKISVGSDIIGGDWNVAGAYDSSLNDVRIREDIMRTESGKTVPVHEFSHALEEGNQPYSDKFKREFTDKIFIRPTNSKYEGYVQQPTEIKARLDAIRYLGEKNKLFDAGKTDFTEKDWNKIINSKEIKNDANFKQIVDQLPENRKKVGFMWLMNNIAKVDTSHNDDIVV